MRLLMLFTFLVSCGAPDLNIPKSDHFDGQRFYNHNPPEVSKGFWDFFKWRMLGERVEWPEHIEVRPQKIPRTRVEKGEVVATFINHATVLLQVDGYNILTDPLYSERSSPVQWAGPKRVRRPGVAFKDLPTIDLVLISHNHYDAMDIPTLKKLIKRDNPTIIFGLGNSYYLEDEMKTKTIELDWYQEHKFNDLNIIFLPCQHWSKRTLSDRNQSLWGAFAIQGSKQIYFAGDSGYAPHFKTTYEKLGVFDLALIPIGAYEPRWFMKYHHMNPEESFKAHLDLHSKTSIGIHFGTFQLTDEGVDAPIKDLRKEISKHPDAPPFLILEHGESHKL